MKTIRMLQLISTRALEPFQCKRKASDSRPEKTDRAPASPEASQLEKEWKVLKFNWKIGYLFLLFLSGVGLASAQSPVIDAYVREGLQNNLALKAHQLQVAQALTRLRQAKANFFPKITFDANYTMAQGGRSIDIPIGDLLNPVYSTLNQITQSDAFPMLDNVSEQFLPHNFQETKLSLTQPLFNSDVYFGYKARQAQVEVEKARKMAYAQNLAHEIRIAWLRHLQAQQAAAIYRDARTVLEELHRVNQRLVARQKATPDIVATAQAELAGIDQEIAANQQQIAVSAAWFNFLLNRNLEAEILLDSALTLPDHSAESFTALKQQAENNRQELAALRQGIQASQTLADMKKYDAFLPDLYLAGQAGFQGFGYDFGDNQDFWLAQVGLSWDLFQGRGKQAAREEADLQVSLLENQYQSLVQQLQLQVLQARSGLRTAEQGLAAARSQQEAARQAFRLIRKRYEAGQAMLLEFTQARNQLTTAEIACNLARFDLLIQTSELNKAIAAQ